MRAQTFLLTTASCLYATNIVANPIAPGAAPGNVGIAGANPFSGITITARQEKGCNGKNQGTTNIDAGRTGCVNLSNAGSYTVTTDACWAAYIETYERTDCRGLVTGNETLNGGCYDKRGAYASARIYPRRC